MFYVTINGYENLSLTIECAYYFHYMQNGYNKCVQFTPAYFQQLILIVSAAGMSLEIISPGG